MNIATKNKLPDVAFADGSAVEFVISYFTDPLCIWSWAFEGEWQKLRAALGNRAKIAYHMGGLIPDWATFRDNANSIGRPAQMAPMWMHVAEITKVKLQSDIWMRDPPSSSYPACIAFKCAELQSSQAGGLYLAILRQTVMLEGQNISKTDILLSLAKNPVMELVGFDCGKFKTDLLGGLGREEFRQDLQLTQQLRVERFPSLVIRRADKSSILISGYKTADEILRVIEL